MRDEGEMDFRRGFTLVEILIALVVLGILLVAATSTFRETGDKYRAESETKQLFADLTDARARAMQRSRIFFVRLRTTGYETFEDTNTGPDGNGSLETASDAPAAGRPCGTRSTRRTSRGISWEGRRPSVSIGAGSRPRPGTSGSSRTTTRITTAS